MDVPLRMPDLATTGATIKVLRWLVEPGQAVRRGDPLLEVETDKAVMQVEAAAAGMLKVIVAAEGAEVDAGQTIAVLDGESSPPPLQARGEGATASAQAPSRPDPVASRDPDSRRRSFFARNREARTSEATSPLPPRTIALSVPQKVAAQRMAESKRTVPHFYLQTSANAEAMLARRRATAGRAIWDAFFIRAASNALKRFPRMGFRFEVDRLIAGPDAVNLAVDVEDDLFTLAVENPAAKSVEAISGEITAGVEKLRAGDPRARVARPACLTVSNLGGYGIESFAAVINPPESAILAVGKVAPAAVVADGQVIVQHRVNLTISVDHRVASGRYAAVFLNEIVRELESMDPFGAGV